MASDDTNRNFEGCALSPSSLPLTQAPSPSPGSEIIVHLEGTTPNDHGPVNVYKKLKKK